LYFACYRVQHARNIKDFSQAGRAFFSDKFEYDPEAQKKFWKDARLPELLEELGARLANAKPFDLAETEACLRVFAEEKGVKAGMLINATRVALTGQAVAPGLFEVMMALGQSRVVERLRRAANHLRTALDSSSPQRRGDTGN
jgi:glutamyl-tRNA synthetase